MSAKTGIEWTDATWNPLRGCSRVSEGCRHCYAEGVAKRFSGPGLPYEGLIAKGGQWNGAIKLVPELLDQPLRWRKPRRIFVNSMSDLFHENVPESYVQQVFAVMAKARQHTFQILTKRPDRMRAMLAGKDLRWLVDGCLQLINDGRMSPEAFSMQWPLPNVWLGVSVEDQKTASERIPVLLNTPAAVRWVSAEPLLGAVDLTCIGYSPADSDWTYCWDALSGFRANKCGGTEGNPKLDWVVVGGESGKDARPMHPEWARSLRDQCAAAGVPFLFKQWGEWVPGESLIPNPPERVGRRPHASWFANDWIFGETNMDDPEDNWMDEPDLYRVGKRLATRLLDGVLHDGYPGAQS